MRKQGGYTAYELACGSVQSYETDFHKQQLYKEHTVYHVRVWSKFIDGRWIQDHWLTFERLSDARRAYARQFNLNVERAS